MTTAWIKITPCCNIIGTLYIVIKMLRWINAYGTYSKVLREEMDRNFDHDELDSSCISGWRLPKNQVPWLLCVLANLLCHHFDDTSRLILFLALMEVVKYLSTRLFLSVERPRFVCIALSEVWSSCYRRITFERMWKQRCPYFSHAFAQLPSSNQAIIVFSKRFQEPTKELWITFDSWL